MGMAVAVKKCHPNPQELFINHFYMWYVYNTGNDGLEEW
jgi:hypothetical protein